MRARRRSSGIRAVVLALLALLCTSLAAGCATLQQDGAVTRATEGDAGASQVQIWPSSPGKDEPANEIVNGFLEAARSGTSNQRIAAAYLTPDMKKQWQAEQNTVIVLADYSEGTPQLLEGTGVQEGPQDPDGDSIPNGTKIVEQVQGTLLGRLDANGLYSAQSGTDSYDFTVEKTQDGWRIEALPAGFGALMERSDFESFYTRHVVYYENPQQSEQGSMIPTQVYLPSVETDDQVSAQVAKLVVNGVPDQLASVMQNAVTGVTYQGLEVADNGLAVVTVESGGRCAEKSRCSGLALQLAQTLLRLNSKITSVEVKDAATGALSEPAGLRDDLISYGPTPQLGGTGVSSFYAISSTGQLEELEMSGSVADADVLKGNKLFSSVTASTPVSGEIRRLALVSKDHATISVAQQRGGAWQLSTVYPAAGSSGGGSVGRAGWDSSGDLWFTATLNGITSVYRYGENSLDQVTVSGAGGSTIDEVLPAPDGDRVAVRVTSAAGAQSIIIGAVSEIDGSYGLDLDGAQYAAYGWNSITDFDWYDEELLAVLGMQPGSQSLGLYQIYADGSANYDSLTSQPVQAGPPAQAGSFVWTVAGRPIASSPSQGKNTFYTLSVEGQDAQQMGALTGTSPTY